MEGPLSCGQVCPGADARFFPGLVIFFHKLEKMLQIS